MVVHLGVLAFYIALCIVCATGVEKHVQVSLKSAPHVQTWINLITHVRLLRDIQALQ